MVFNAPFFPTSKNQELSHPYADILQACYSRGFVHHRAVLAAIIAHASNLINSHLVEIDDEVYVFVEKVVGLCGWISNFCTDRTVAERIWKIVETYGLTPVEAGTDVDALKVREEPTGYYTMTSERMYGRLFDLMVKKDVRSHMALPMAVVLHIGALNSYNMAYIDAEFVKIFEAATPKILCDIADLVYRDGL